MITPTRGALRVARSGVLALACTAVSTAGHVAGGGVAPGATAMVGLTVACWALALAVSAQQWTAGRLLIMLGSAQLTCHLILGADVPAGATNTVHSGPAPAMPLGHLAAAAVLALLLTRADRAIWRLAELLVALAGRLRPAKRGPMTPLPPRIHRQWPTSELTAGGGRRLAAEVSRRGPPTRSRG
jgi:hypothetical protein